MLQKRVMGRRGVVLREVVAVVCVVGTSLSLLLVGASEVRRNGGLVEDEGKLRWHAQMTDAYAAAHDDRYWTFSPPWIGDAATEAIEIMNRLAARSTPVEDRGNWLPHVQYSSLALADWLGLAIPDERFISSGDELLLAWASDPEHYNQLGVPAPDFDGIPYKSSFTQPPAFWSYPWSGERAVSPVSSSHSQFRVDPSTELGGRRLGEVEFPSRKVFLHDSHDRFFSDLAPGNLTGTQLHFGYEGARIPILFADGSVRVTRTGDTNVGWVPSAINSRFGSRMMYRPAAWEPATASGEDRDLVGAWYRYTRGGMRGIDVGPESGEGLVRDVLPGRRRMR